MANIISIDASSKGCSVSLLRDAKVVSFVENTEEKSAATYLTSYIAQVCKEAGIAINEIDAVAVAKGPGSYTGLRVAVSTAKGLAMALKIPLISYDTLDAIYSQVEILSYTYICPMLDARRAEVYCKIVNTESKEIVLETEAVIVDDVYFNSFLDKGTCLFVGEGSEKCKMLISHPNAKYLENNIGTQSWHAAKLIFEKYAKSEFEDLVSFEPFYLKEYMFKQKKEQ